MREWVFGRNLALVGFELKESYCWTLRLAHSWEQERGWDLGKVKECNID